MHNYINIMYSNYFNSIYLNVNITRDCEIKYSEPSYGFTCENFIKVIYTLFKF